MRAAFVFASAFCVALIRAAPDLPALIARADLHYPAPVMRSEDGIPIGNGRMGSLVWTTPTALKFQINRVDVQPVSATSNSFAERNSDYMGGCGFVDLDLGGAGDDVFTAENCPQHLSVYDALATFTGRGVTARVLAWPGQDVMAVELDDQRAQPEPLSINLRMLRSAPQGVGGSYETMVRDHIVTVRTKNHTAASQLSVHGDRIVLTQEFREGTHFAKSALAIALVTSAPRSRASGRTRKTATPSNTPRRGAGARAFAAAVDFVICFNSRRSTATTARRSSRSRLRAAPTLPPSRPTAPVPRSSRENSLGSRTRGRPCASG